MGNDEHGPAYPEPDDLATHVHNHHEARRETLRPEEPFLVTRILITVAIVVAILLYAIWPVHAMNHGFPPDAPMTVWMEKQIRPDSPPNSCCGVADAYPVDRYEKLPGGDFQVWIQNGDAIEFPDGTRRAPWDISIPLTVPFNKVNKAEDDLDNPSNHGWLFFRPSNDHEPGTFYCFIRHPQGN
jgi:hypothetical protein